jgi:uncharacterized protein (UPF0335 family)
VRSGDELREENKLQLYDKKALRRLFKIKKQEVKEASRERFIMNSFITN